MTLSQAARDPIVLPLTVTAHRGESPSASRLVACGVEGLITDVPREMIASLRSPGFSGSP